MPGFCDTDGHVEPAVSVRLCLKTHESNNSLNVCQVVEDEMDDETMDNKEEPSEESRPVKGGQSRVMMPTLKERQEHERTHLPYRSWCRHCVAARASNHAHRGRKFPTAIEEDKDTMQVSYDYCFMRDQPGMESAKILVSKDRATRTVSAHVAPLMGAVLDWVIQQCARDLERLGHHGQAPLKSDQEAAIVDLLGEIAHLRGSRGTLLEQSPVADSPSNGLIERGIRSVEVMTRVLLYDLSSRVGSLVTLRCFRGFVEHATDILNKCHVASDGKPAYERLEKGPHRGELLPFGASVMFRVAGKVPGGLMMERWHLGTWLGKLFHTEEHIVERKGDGLVIRSRAVKVMPEPTTMDDLDAMKGSPWALAGVLRDVLPDVPRPILSRDDPSAEPEKERPVPRNMKITQDILKKFGYTPGCVKCRKLSRNEYLYIRAWQIHKIVASELRQRARQTRRIVIELNEQSSERWTSTRKKWNRWIMQGELPWNRVLCQDHQLQKLKLNTIQNVPKAKRAREEPAQDL